MTDTTHDQDDFDANSTMNNNYSDPGHPMVRLSEVDKQLTLAIRDLETESEHVDPDPITELENALQTVRDATETLDAQARETDTVLRGDE